MLLHRRSEVKKINFVVKKSEWKKFTIFRIYSRLHRAPKFTPVVKLDSKRNLKKNGASSFWGRNKCNNFYYYTASFKKSKWITMSEQLEFFESNVVQFFFLNFISIIIFELLKSDRGPVLVFCKDKQIWARLRCEAWCICFGKFRFNGTC